MLSFICVRREALTSWVYNVHLARQIFHAQFWAGEWNQSFNPTSNIRLWTDLLWGEEWQKLYFPAWSKEKRSNNIYIHTYTQQPTLEMRHLNQPNKYMHESLRPSVWFRKKENHQQQLLSGSCGLLFVNQMLLKLVASECSFVLGLLLFFMTLWSCQEVVGKSRAGFRSLAAKNKTGIRQQHLGLRVAKRYPGPEQERAQEALWGLHLPPESQNVTSGAAKCSEGSKAWQ